MSRLHDTLAPQFGSIGHMGRSTGSPRLRFLLDLIRMPAFEAHSLLPGLFPPSNAFGAGGGLELILVRRVALMPVRPRKCNTWNFVL